MEIVWPKPGPNPLFEEEELVAATGDRGLGWNAGDNGCVVQCHKYSDVSQGCSGEYEPLLPDMCQAWQYRPGNLEQLYLQFVNS